MQDIKIGKSGPLDITAAPSAVVCGILMAAVLAAVAYYLLHLPIFESVVGGLVATFFHFDAELWHQHGHAAAASRTGHPMTGIRMWAIFGASIYPPDEPELPAETHIERALGGPRYSLVMTVAAGVMAAIIYTVSGPTDWIYYIFVFFFLDNLFFFTLGSFLPLGFTDGSTLLTWWPKRSHPDEPSR